MADIYEEALALHKKHQGKIKIEPVVPLKDKHELSLFYTPGVAEASRQIAKNKELAFDLTWRGRVVAVISDGSAVLGLGNIGPEAALPVMEGKALLLKQFGGVDSVPIVINTQDTAEIIRFVEHIAPSFIGINLEDISAPRCFQIEEALQHIGIPVFHDDQHGTAIVIAAALRNAAKVVGKPYESLNVVIVGAGAAGLATAKMLMGLDCSADSCRRIPGHKSVKDVIVVDRQGALYSSRDNQNIYKQAVSGVSNITKKQGQLEDVVKGADVIVGLSGQPNAITKEMVSTMAKDAIVFAMGNPIPEIMPEDALKSGAAVVATGRSDFPNQINNVLVFPGIFRAVIKGRLKIIDQSMKDAAVDALSNFVEKPTKTNIIPDVFAPGLAEYIADAILKK
jgi:malate dehydrogenase (oxaloacetate-decarboxylating)